MTFVWGGESLTVSEEGAILGLLVLSLVTDYFSLEVYYSNVSLSWKL